MEKTPELIEAEKVVSAFISTEIRNNKILFETKAGKTMAARQFVESRINESIKFQKERLKELNEKFPESMRAAFYEGAIEAFESCLSIIKREFEFDSVKLY